MANDELAKVSSTLRDAWRHVQMIADPEARRRFKAEHRGLRTVEQGSTAISLTLDDETSRKSCLARRTERRYADAPLGLKCFSDLLGHLRAVSLGDDLKYAYGSAGSSYAVQTYLYVKPNRVSGVTEGTWYYHPVRHELYSLHPQARVSAELHYFENRNIFESSAFSIFFIGKMDAIAPLYGDKSRDFALIEAGLMTQILEQQAADLGIGLCQIGDFRFSGVRSELLLGPNDILLHSMLGGRLPSHAAEVTEARATGAP